MNTIRFFLSAVALMVVLVSCQKEIDSGVGGGNGSNKNIIGDWDFVGMTASTNATVTVPSPLGETKVVTTSAYRTENNTGTVKITGTEFIYNNFGYSIDTVMNVKTYMAGLLIDNTNMPFAITSPPLSDTTTYTKISSDSLNVNGFAGVPDPTGMMPTGPVGVKIGWSGDTLLLKVQTTISQNINQGGVNATLSGSVNGVTKLKRR